MNVILDIPDKILKQYKEKAKGKGLSRKSFMELVLIELATKEINIGNRPVEIADFKIDKAVVSKNTMQVDISDVKVKNLTKEATTGKPFEPKENTNAFFLKYGVMTYKEIKK